MIIKNLEFVTGISNNWYFLIQIFFDMFPKINLDLRYVNLLLSFSQYSVRRFRTINKSFAHPFSSTCGDDMSKIGINGFGRIGRLVLRASIDREGQVRKIILKYRRYVYEEKKKYVFVILTGCRHQWSLHWPGLHGIYVQIWLHSWKIQGRG